MNQEGANIPLLVWIAVSQGGQGLYQALRDARTAGRRRTHYCMLEAAKHTRRPLQRYALLGPLGIQPPST